MDRMEGHDHSKMEDSEITSWKRKLVWSWVFAVPIALLMLLDRIFGYNPFMGLVGAESYMTILILVLAFPIVFVFGFHTMKYGLKGLFTFYFGMDSLISLGTLVAYLTGVFSLFFSIVDYSGVSGMIMAIFITGKYIESKAKITKATLYSLEDAIKLVKDISSIKFDGTFEMHLVMKKVGITAQVTLPFSAGKQKKVEIADDKTVEKLKAGKIDFDLLLATAEMMPKLVVFARLLGPKGLMPNPKNGTVIKSLKDADKFKGNMVTIKTERETPLIHTSFGKVSQKNEELVKNAEAIILSLGGSKTITRAFIKSTMSPSVKVMIK